MKTSVKTLILVLVLICSIIYPALGWDTTAIGTGYDSLGSSDRVILVVPNTTAVTNIYTVQWVPDLAVPGTISALFPLSGTVYNSGFTPIGTYTATRDTYDANHTGITVTMDLTGSLSSMNIIGGWGLTGVWTTTLGTGENLTPSYSPSLRYVGYPIRGTTYCNLGALPSINFTASVTSGNVPLAVTFTDNSADFPTSPPYATYAIDFDDGSYWEGEWQYSGENWFHFYETAGTYNVTYTITYNSIQYVDYEIITVNDAETNYYVQVSGLNTVPIEGANVSIWYDGSYQDSEGTSPLGRAYFDIPAMRWVNGTVTKSGYQQANFSQYINTWDTWTSVTLYLNNETVGLGDNYGNHIITFRDAITDALIEDVTVTIYEDSGYSNQYSSEYTTSGVYTALIPLNVDMYYRAEATNYNDLEFSSNTTTSPTYSTRYMIPTNYGSMLPNLHVWVYTTGGAPISSAVVDVFSTTDSGTHTTNISGYAIHYCDAMAYNTSRVYSVTVSRGGYTSQTASVTVSSQNPTVTFYLSASTGATTSPTQTAVYTTPPTPIWSGTNGTPGNYKEQFLNFVMTQFGVGSGEASILIGLVLTLLSAVFVGGCLAGFGSGEGAGMGALIGGAFGWVASGMLGFIPLWAIVITIALIAMIFFIFRSPGGG